MMKSGLYLKSVVLEAVRKSLKEKARVVMLSLFGRMGDVRPDYKRDGRDLWECM